MCFFVLASQALGEAFVPELSGEAYVRLVVSAVLGISMADTMFASALNRLGASLQALADCVYAPAIAVVGFMMFGEWLGFWELLGGLLVVSGVVVGMRVTPDVKSRRDLVIGVFLTAGAHVIMAVGILFVPRRLSGSVGSVGVRISVPCCDDCFSCLRVLSGRSRDKCS